MLSPLFFNFEIILVKINNLICLGWLVQIFTLPRLSDKPNLMRS